KNSPRKARKTRKKNKRKIAKTVLIPTRLYFFFRVFRVFRGECLCEVRAVSTEQSWTIGRLLDWTTRFLQQKGSESPRLDSEVLLAHALGCKRIELYTRHMVEAPEQGRQRFRELVRQRIEGCPVAYLVGRKEFFSLEFEVNRAVLIPRPD